MQFPVAELLQQPLHGCRQPACIRAPGIDASDVKPDVKLNEDLYEAYKTSDRANWGEHFVENRDFKMGAQWEAEDADALESANEPALSINEIAPSIDLVVSMLTENNPRFQVVAAEPSDTGLASDVSDLHNYIWDISSGTMVMERACNDFEDGGMGAFFVFTDSLADYGKGEIKVTDVDPLDLYIDPNSKKIDCSDASHMLIVKNLTDEQIKKINPNFPFDKAQGLEADSYPLSTRDLPEDQVQYPEIPSVTGKSMKYRAIDRYTKVYEKRYHVLDEISGFEKVLKEEDMKAYMLEPVAITVTQGMETYETKPRKVQELKQLAENTGGTYHYMINPMSGQPEMMPGAEHGDNAIPGSTTQIKMTNKAELIDSGIIKVSNPKIPRVKRVFTIGNIEIAKDILPIEDYPIIPFMLHHQRNPFPHEALAHGHPCRTCGALCCRYVAVALAAPKESDDRDLIRWYLTHREVCVYIDRDGDWWVQVGTDCRHLAADGSCRDYESRPQLCRDYGTETCEQADHDDENIAEFTTVAQFERFFSGPTSAPRGSACAAGTGATSSRPPEGPAAG